MLSVCGGERKNILGFFVLSDCFIVKFLYAMGCYAAA
jgi:hypothetical protein